eukprot:scaffold12278_cov129-Isochrysis_galbana.AAC.2
MALRPHVIQRLSLVAVGVGSLIHGAALWGAQFGSTGSGKPARPEAGPTLTPFSPSPPPRASNALRPVRGL